MTGVQTCALPIWKPIAHNVKMAKDGVTEVEVMLEESAEKDIDEENKENKNNG